MINENYAKRYCCEDISLIENYQAAISDQTRMWDIHHRRECDDEGKTLFTKKQLIEMNLYYQRPANELIFVTRSIHIKIHKDEQHKWHSNGGKIGGKSSSKIEKQSIPILQFNKDGTFIKEWPSLSEAGRQLKTSIGNICNCCEGNRKSAGCYIWKYKNV